MDNRILDLFSRVDKTTQMTWTMLGRVAEAQEDYESASRCFMRAVAFDNTNKENMSCAVRCCAELEKPKRDAIWCAIGSKHVRHNEIMEAHAAYKNALTANPRLAQDPNVLTEIGKMYLRHGSIHQAKLAIARALEFGSSFWAWGEAQFQFGLVHLQQQKPFLALECFERIVDSPPSPLTKGDVVFQMGMAHEQNRSFLLARNAYQAILKDDPHHVRTLGQMAWLHCTQGTPRNHKIGLELFEQVIQLDSTNPVVWLLKGRVHAEDNLLDEAFAALQQSLTYDAQDALAWSELGCIYLAAGNFEQAQFALNQSVSINPFIGESWYNLGVVYAKLGQQDKAQSAFEAAQRLNGHPHVAMRLERLRTNSTAKKLQTKLVEPMRVDLLNPYKNLRPQVLPELLPHP